MQPHIITKVRTADGKLLYQRKRVKQWPGHRSAICGDDERHADETLLTGTASKADLPGWEAAGKTGTSQDYRDAWFVGYTSQLVTGVWLGNDDNSPTKKASGGNLPVEIWSRYMRDALKGMVVAGLPGGGWRSESLLGGAAASLWPQPAPAPAPAPRPPTVHLDTSNPSAPIVVEGAGHIAGDPAERDDEPPIPPEDIPDTRRTRQPPPDDWNFIGRLFGQGDR